LISLASLGSGSKGNATLVRTSATSVLIDNGFSIKEAVARAAALDFDLATLDGILVTHEHSDHIAGVAKLARKFNLDIYTSVGTWVAKKQPALSSVKYICSHTPFNIGDLSITPIAVPHDAREPLQFLFEHQGVRCGVLTDLGSVSPHIFKTMSDLDGLLIEFNHCQQLLATGPYPYSLKKRVAGEFGHLNNHQALNFVEQLDLERLQLLVAGHISEKNNCKDLVRNMLSDIESRVSKLVVAEQSQGFSWATISR